MADGSEFVVVGTGWRAEAFLRSARGLAGIAECVGVVGRRRGRLDELERVYGVPGWESFEEGLDRHVDFAVLVVSREANTDLLEGLAARGVPVLIETPPGLDAGELRRAWEVSQSTPVQVAEQYRFQPQHAARLAVLDQGVIGERHQATVSVAHGYHAASLLTEYLGVVDKGWEDVTVTGSVVRGPVVRGPGRAGPPVSEEVIVSERMIGVVRGGTKAGICDFDGEQYFSEIRRQSVAVRGERGELWDDEVRFLPAGEAWRARSERFERIEGGRYGDLTGLGLHEIRFGGQVVFSARRGPALLTDEEQAIAECLARMATYVTTGTEFYSVERACRDRYLELVMAESAARGCSISCPLDGWKESCSSI